ncbi:MAG: hypothetical protein BGO70_14720 [Bacteroidetes bacterium 43-93]|nr:hypothetical protein [Bacteroidota bacterium]OJX01036.1 MAG: hypothetical protein BGO70_14720 [Bacteroidetes bacterium 43-93]
MGDLNNIWTDPEGKLPEDKLLAYLEGKLAPGEQHKVEQWLNGEGMEADAVEGLKELPAEDSKEAVDRINYRLRQTIDAKRRRRTRAITGNKWALLAVVVILLLCIVGYIVISLTKK